MKKLLPFRLERFIYSLFDSNEKSIASKRWYIQTQLKEEIGNPYYIFEFFIYSSRISKPIFIKLNYNRKISNDIELVDYIIDDSIPRHEAIGYNELRKELLIEQKQDIVIEKEILITKNKQEKQRKTEQKKRKEKNIKQFKKEQKRSNLLEDIVF